MNVAIAVIVGLVLVGWLLSRQSKGRSRDELLRLSVLAEADAMTGPQFERYFADLLRLRGYRYVQVVGGAGDGGIDILATDPAGVRVAYQCKRQKATVSVAVVRQLIGSVNHEHKGRVAHLVTTATLTKPAADLARSARVQVVDRALLGKLMAEARLQLSGTTDEGKNQPVETPPSPLSPKKPDEPIAPARMRLAQARMHPTKPSGQPIPAIQVAGPSNHSPKPAASKSLRSFSDKTVISGDGIFVVGIDIRPGVYRTPGPADDEGYYALLSSTNTHDIINNDNVSGPVTITVGPGVKAVQVEGFKPWQRIGDDLDSAIQAAAQ
jgi:restriction system protein